MFVRGVLLLAVLVGYAAPPAVAQGVSSAPVGVCEFRDQVAEAMFQSIERGAAIGERAKPLLGSLDRLTAKAKQADIPVEKQLDAADLSEFRKVSEALTVLRAQKLVERRRQRDLQVVNRMVALADQSYRFGIEPASDNGRDDLVLSSLRLIRSALEETPFNVSSAPDGCSIAAALFHLKVEALSKVIQFDLSKVRELGEQLKAKYAMAGTVERDRLSPEDRSVWDAVVKEIVIPSERVRGFVLDIEASLVALRASDIVYASDREDVEANAGDLGQLGASLRRRAEANEFDKATVTAIGIWRLANENALIK